MGMSHGHMTIYGHVVWDEACFRYTMKKAPYMSIFTIASTMYARVMVTVTVWGRVRGRGRARFRVRFMVRVRLRCR